MMSGSGPMPLPAGYSVVGAKEYPAGSILAGYPARRIGEREKNNPDA